jgi:molybdenum cofactor cytidylyltransferase
MQVRGDGARSRARELPEGGRGVVAAITAAGRSRRMGTPKQLLRWGGASLVGKMVDTVRRAGLGRPAVVVGAHREAVLEEVLNAGAHVLENPEFARGRFTSIRVAARWAVGLAGRPALLLWPVDCPGVLAGTIRRLVGESQRHPDADVVPRCGERRGHPVVLCGETLTAIERARDGNLRELIGGSRGGRRVVDVEDAGVLDNLNTMRDYDVFLERCRDEKHGGRERA